MLALSLLKTAKITLRHLATVGLSLSVICLSACSLSSENTISLFSEDSPEPSSHSLRGDRQKELPEKKSNTQNQKLEEFSSAWLYGHGMGRTMLNVGTVIVFPPYALYLLGNAGLQLAGYEELRLSALLPEPAEELFSGAYNGVTSVPGRISAEIAGREFDDRLAKEVKVSPAGELESKP